MGEADDVTRYSPYDPFWMYMGFVNSASATIE